MSECKSYYVRDGKEMSTCPVPKRNAMEKITQRTGNGRAGCVSRWLKYREKKRGDNMEEVELKESEIKILQVKNGNLVEIPFYKLKAQIQREMSSNMRHEVALLRDKCNDILKEQFADLTLVFGSRRGVVLNELRNWVADGRASFTQKEVQQNVSTKFAGQIENRKLYQQTYMALAKLRKENIIARKPEGLYVVLKKEKKSAAKVSNKKTVEDGENEQD